MYRSRFNLRKVVAIAICLAGLLISGCDIFPEPDKTLDEPYGEEGAKLIKEVASKCDSYINDFLQNSDFDRDEFAKMQDNILSARNVKNLSINSDSSIIKIGLTSGAYVNWIIKSPDRYYEYDDNDKDMRSLATTMASQKPPIYSKPDLKTALILAPLHSSEFLYGQDFDILQNCIKSAGYSVTIIKDTVSVEYFRGKYLSQFGIIYIITHGNAEMHKGKMRSFLLTSTLYDDVIKSFDENKNVLVRRSGKTYIAVTEEWIEPNLDLHNSFVFINSCYASANFNFVDMFLLNGARAFVGWSKTKYIWNMYSTAESFFAEMGCYGSEFHEVTLPLVGVDGLVRDTRTGLPFYFY